MKNDNRMHTIKVMKSLGEYIEDAENDLIVLVNYAIQKFDVMRAIATMELKYAEACNDNLAAKEATDCLYYIDKTMKFLVSTRELSQLEIQNTKAYKAEVYKAMQKFLSDNPIEDR